MPRGRALAPFLAVLLLCSAALAGGQEFEPRAYAVTPAGLSFFSLNYAFASGAVLMDPALPVEDMDAQVHVLLARYIRTLELFGRPTKLKLVLPWSSGHWEGLLEAEHRIRDASGLGDARIVVETQFAGAQVRRPHETAESGPGTVWGARLQVVVPTGQYEGSKAVNLGSNRWVLIPEIGFAQPVGRWSLEVAVGAWFFGDNDNYVEGMLLEQDPLLVAKVNAIRPIRPGFWWAVSAGYGYDGRTYVEGVRRATIQRNWRFAVLLAYPLSADQGISLMLGSGGNFGAGTDFDSIAVGYQFAWGKP